MTLVIARWNASLDTPISPLEVFHNACGMGADWVEVDVRRTADGLVVVHHDAHLPDGRRIATLRSDELPSEVPGLAEALEADSGMGVVVQIKNLPDDPDFDQDNLVALAVAGLIGAYLDPRHSVVSSDNVDAVNAIKAVDPTIPLALVCGVIDPAAALSRAVAHEMSAIHAYEAMCVQSFVKGAHRAGMSVFVWGADNAERMADLTEMGIDGIITDHPDVARSVIGPPPNNRPERTGVETDTGTKTETGC